MESFHLEKKNPHCFNLYALNADVRLVSSDLPPYGLMHIKTGCPGHGVEAELQNLQRWLRDMAVTSVCSPALASSGLDGGAVAPLTAKDRVAEVLGGLKDRLQPVSHDMKHDVKVRTRAARSDRRVG